MAGTRVESHCIFDGTPSMFRRNAETIGQMDELDRRLLDLLRENARAPVAELARALGVSRTTLQSRLERLERSGVIAGYTVRLAEAHERGQIHAYVLMTVSHKQSAAVVQAIRKMSAVRLLQSVSGPFDLIARAVAPGVKEMDDLIDALGALPGVERTTSSIVLSTKVDR
jgi:DNA-binding Lrp family transcriptional regulator